MTANFEQAVRASTGELVALCDQDDLWQPDRLAQIVAEFQAQPSLTLLHHDARLVNEQGTPLGTTLSRAIGFTSSERRKESNGDAFGVLLRRNTVTGATTVFRRTLLDTAVPFPQGWVHDEWLAMVASIVGRVDFLPESLTDYRQHASNQIGASRPTLGDKVSRVRAPRAERNQRLLARARSLEARLKEIDGVPKRILDLAAAKRRHEEARSALPDARVLRIVPILNSVLRGGYHRFGRARYDIVRDLLQPAG